MFNKTAELERRIEELERQLKEKTTADVTVYSKGVGYGRGMSTNDVVLEIINYFGLYWEHKEGIPERIKLKSIKDEK